MVAAACDDYGLKLNKIKHVCHRINILGLHRHSALIFLHDVKFSQCQGIPLTQVLIIHRKNYGPTYMNPKRFWHPNFCSRMRELYPSDLRDKSNQIVRCNKCSSKHCNSMRLFKLICVTSCHICILLHEYMESNVHRTTLREQVNTPRMPTFETHKGQAHVHESHIIVSNNPPHERSIFQCRMVHFHNKKKTYIRGLMMECLVRTRGHNQFYKRKFESR